MLPCFIVGHPSHQRKRYPGLESSKINVTYSNRLSRQNAGDSALTMKPGNSHMLIEVFIS